MGIVAELDKAATLAELKDTLAQSSDAIDALHDIAKDIYYVAEGDVLNLLGDADKLASDVYGIVTGAANGWINEDAVPAITDSAAAITTAVTDSVGHIKTAIGAYEQAVRDAAAIIIPAVTDAAEAIGEQVAGVAEIATDAVDAAIEKAEELDAILAALDNVVYDATHAEVNLNCGEELIVVGADEATTDAHVIVADFNGDGFINAMANQVVGLVAGTAYDVVSDVLAKINADPDLSVLVKNYLPEDIDAILAQAKELGDSYVPTTWAGFDSAAIAAKDEILTIIENILVEQLEALGLADGKFSEDLVDVIGMIEDADIMDAETAEIVIPIKNILGRMGFEATVEIDVIDLLLDAAESVLYGYFSFAVEFPAELNAIRAEYPEAQVVVLGLSDVYAATLPEAAEYIELVVDALNAHLFAYAAINTNTTYVDDIANLADAIIVTHADCAWGAATYEWAADYSSCTATRVCANNAAHVETETVASTSVVKEPATETVKGWHTYTADFVAEWADTQTIDVQDIPATGGVTPPGPSGPTGGGGYRWHCNGGAHCPSCQYADLAEVIKTNPRIWWHEYTDYVIKNKLMNGMQDEPEKLFMPNYTTTRAMLVTILWREAGSPVVDYEMAFEDVEANTWYTEAIRWAASKGIVDGMSDTEFAPDAKITREQMVTIFYRYAKNHGVNMNRGNSKTIEKFCDVENISDWAYDAVKWACGINFVDGKENNNIDPVGNATRAEMATLIMRFIEDVM